MSKLDAFLDALGLPEPPATKLDDTMLKDIKKLEEHKVNSFRVRSFLSRHRETEKMS